MSKFKLLFVALLLLLASFKASWLPVFADDKDLSAHSTALSHINFDPYPLMNYPIRIGLADRSVLSYIAVFYPGALFVDEKPVFALIPQHIYSLQHGRITELASGKSYPLPHDRRSYITAADYRVWAHNHWYRGCLELVMRGDRITVINLLDLEDYLRGVVPAEMPATWQIEALKAQAVAARSYAFAHTGVNSKWYRTEGYDLVPDVRDQCYKGLAVETRSTDWAVKDTLGIILKNAGRVKSGFYRATVGDAFENLNIRQSSISNAVLEKITGVPKIIGVTVKQWYPNGNVHSLQIMGTKKSREVDGVAFAKMLHFSSACILDVRQLDTDWLFTYRGPGNGARGLSQHGANTFAQRGWKFDQILSQYYQDPDGHVYFDRLNPYRYMERYKQRSMHTSKNEASTDTTSE